MVSSPTPPTPPDPKVTAAAQTGMNIDTAQAQQLTNMVNQNTPDGSLTYSQNGTRSFVDSSGKTVQIPNYTSTTTLSPTQQALYDTSNQTKQALGQIGLDETGRIGSILSTPVDLSGKAMNDLLYSEYSPRVNAQQTQQNSALQSQLAAQGVTAGSDAYNNAMRLQTQGNNDQWNQLYLNGQSQATQNALTQRQEPINEISALMGGSQVSNPNFTSTPTASVAGTDYTGAVANNYNAQMQQYNAQLSQSNAAMGGIFGTLGSLAGGWAMSDRRMKTAIRYIGRIRNGLPVYAFKYVWGGPVQVGLMAQEVAKVFPHAVKPIHGAYHVNYDLAMVA